MSHNVTEGEEIHPGVSQKSAEGKVGHAVGKASKELPVTLSKNSRLWD